MGADTKIEWARHTFNAWVGCTKIAGPRGAPSACDFCYAEAWAKRSGHPELWNGERRRTSPANWREPPKWDKAAAAAGERHTVFSNSLADVFDNQVPPEWRKDLFDLIRATPNLIWLLLTKRPENIIKMSEAAGGLPPNAALGTTVEDQPCADHRLPHLRSAKGRLQPLFTFLSCEPLLGPLWLDLDHVDWVIAGGESGGKARPSHPGWFRSLRDQCAKAGVAFHFKQWGEWAPTPSGGRSDRLVSFKEIGACPAILSPDGDVVRVGKKHAGRNLDGVEHNGFPVTA